MILNCNHLFEMIFSLAYYCLIKVFFSSKFPIIHKMIDLDHVPNHVNDRQNYSYG